MPDKEKTAQRRIIIIIKQTELIGVYTSTS